MVIAPLAETPANGLSDSHVTSLRVVPADEEGYFSIRDLERGAYAAWFYAADHRPDFVPLLPEMADMEVTVRMGGYDGASLGYEVQGSWMERGAWLRLEPDDAGRFTFEIPPGDAPRTYVLRRLIREGFEYVGNPLASDIFFERARFHMSVPPSVRAVQVTFDPAALQSGEFQAVFADDEEATQIAAMVGEMQRALRESRRLSLGAEDGTYSEATRAPLERTSKALLEIARTTSAPRVRKAAALLALNAGVPEDARPGLIKLLPASDPIWALAPMVLPGGGFAPLMGSPTANFAFVEKLATANPDAHVRAAAYATLATLAHRKNDEAGEAKLLRRLSADYSHIPSAVAYLSISERRHRSSRLGVGRLAPDVDIVGLHGSQLNPARLTGRWILWEFSTPGCPPCIALQPELSKLRDAIPPEALEIVTVSMGEDRERMLSRLEEQPKRRGWHHVALPDHDNALSSAFHIWRFPTLFLVGADGRVAATDAELREDLVKTIRQRISASAARPGDR